MVAVPYASGLLIPKSSTNLQEPLACFFQTVMKLPKAAGFASLRSFQNCQGPVVYPSSPAGATSANIGCQLKTDREFDGGRGCSRIHFFPNTAVGRNKIPSSAINSAKASRVPFSSDVRENARSVSTIDLRSLTWVFC